MEKQSRGRNTSPKLCLSQTNGDDASHLVGGIVEKGFSDPLHSTGPPGFSIAPPRPAVRPFPLARHRSHGPHWKPNIENCNDHGEGVENEMEEDDLKGLYKAGAFAKPVRRKDKKGLDFSSWREAADSRSGSRIHNKEENDDHYISSIERQNFTVQFESAGNLNSGLKSQDLGMPDKKSEEQEETVSDMAIDGQEGHMDVLPNGLNTLSEDIQVDDGQDLMSLEGQIDVENRARLAGMSADEILEAQAEIFAKLSPAGIEALRRRGLNKLKKQNLPSLGSHSTCEKDNHQTEKSMADTAVSSAPVNSNPMNNAIPNEKDSAVDGNIPNSLPTKTGLWDAWSKRVERVRELRFSMDGNIVGNDTTMTENIDTVPSSSDYSPDNVAERDFLRTEGDPGAAGYTIKEAVALTRSVIPGQRALALRLIASVINKAINGICQNRLGYTLNYIATDGSVDWEAIWAFALGPEPELALSLRICLDDNHKSVVLACAKVIQSVLAYDINESFFDIAERIPNYQADIPTAPVFRSRPEIDGGFLHGGFWKYSTKPSNILTSTENSFANKPEDEHSIQDDVMIAGQDIAAGLVRMGILQRICYLLEMDPSTPLEECSMSILIAIARHSPTCANAIMNCKSLVQVIVNRFVEIDPMGINHSKIKSVTLLQILARYSKKNCLEFVKNGIFLKMTLHLYCNSSSLDQWIKRGTEACKFSSALLVEQLRFWKKLIEQNVVNEYVMVAKEAFLVLGSLSKRLPNFYSHQMDAIMEDEDTENWSWSNVGPLIDSSLEWIVIKNIPYISSLLQCQNDDKEYDVINSLMWLVSSVMHMLSGVLEAAVPREDSTVMINGCLPWLPEFVPKIGFEIIKNGFFSFSGETDGTYKDTCSFLECLCRLRLKAGLETSIASTCCLQGMIRVVTSVDKLISLPNCKTLDASSLCVKTLSLEDRILSNGILQSCLSNLGHLMTNLGESIEHKWRPIHSVETFGRGGPAPGIGVGWGASGGGFWSKFVLSAEVDGLLIAHLLDILQIVPPENQLSTLNKEIMCSVIQRVDSTIATCLVVGPKGQYVMDKLFGILFHAPVLKSLDFITRRLIDLNKCLKPFEREYSEEEYLLFSNVLVSHFRNRWLGSKKKPKPEISRSSLETIPEETGVTSPVTPDPASLVVEWAHQRLPLPLHWFLSSLSTIPCSKNSSDTAGFLEVAKGGLFFLFGIEAASKFLGAVSLESPSGIPSGPLLYVPIIWKLHALSNLLLTGTGILEDGNSRAAYENLQGIYGQLLDAQGRTEVKSLNFQSEIHDSYSTFIETLVEQFAAVSYGDLIFGRQVAFYLHRSVEAPVRLATWRALCSAFSLELLPPLDECISTADGYLEPVEDDERILEVYIKSWVSGSLDRASTRSSASFTIALHHLSTIIFKTCTHHTLPLQNKLARSLLRDYSRNQQHEGMMISLIQYEKPETCLRPDTDPEYVSRRKCETENRLQKLREACEGNSSMLRVVEKLASAIAKKHSW